jgi:hypothetical protein
MKSFYLACLAAAASGVQLESDGKVENNLAAIDAIISGAQDSVDSGSVKNIVQNDVTAKVLEQVKDGFDDLSKRNEQHENIQIEAIQDIQAKDITDIIDKASDVAEIIVHVEAPRNPAKALAHLEGVYEDRADDIIDANKVADGEIVKIAKTHAIAQVANDVAEAKVVKQVLTADKATAAVADVIESAKLPFDVDTVAELSNLEKAGNIIEDIACRHGDCGDIEQIKNDPQFDDFLLNVLDDYTQGDEDLEDDFGYASRPDMPDFKFADRPDAPGGPVRIGAPDFTFASRPDSS